MGQSQSQLTECYISYLPLQLPFPPLCLDLDFLFFTNIVPTIQNLKETALVLRGRPYNLEAIQAFGQNWDQGVPIVAQWVKNLM